MTKQKAYVQFSKRIVLLVTIAVTVISLLAVVLCFFRSDTDALISTVRTYINYATIVFAAYSGNSVFEKWLTRGRALMRLRIRLKRKAIFLAAILVKYQKCPSAVVLFAAC